MDGCGRNGPASNRSKDSSRDKLVRRNLRQKNGIFRIALSPLGWVLLAGALLGISFYYPYGYFNKEVTAFGILLLWGVWVISGLWNDIHIKKNRGFRIFRATFVASLFIAGLATLALTRPHLRPIYLIISVALLIVLLLWKMFKPRKNGNVF
jgi:hypothetical protein